MEPFWIIVCIICVPLLFLGAPYIAMFLTLIPIQIIGFIEKIVDFFKDEPTSQTSTLPEKKESPSEQSHKPISSPPKSEAPKQYVRTYPPPRPVQPPQQHKEPVDYLQKYRDKPSSKIRCNSMGNIISSSSEETYKKENSWTIAAIVGTSVFLLLIFVVIVASIVLGQSANPRKEHTHEFVNGQCVSCNAYDEVYCNSEYQSILTTMKSMNDPVYDFYTIRNLLEGLPDDYLQSKKISSQCYTLSDLYSTIRDELFSRNPNDKIIQSAFFSILEKQDDSSYSLWNMTAIVDSFFDVDEYKENSILWSLLYGHWESSSGYYLSYDGQYVSTNLPHPLSYLETYYLPVNGRVIYVNESDIGLGTIAFEVYSIEKNQIIIYCYSTSQWLTLLFKPQSSNSSMNSSSTSSTRYIGNIETKKFHYSWCSYLPDQENRTTLYGRASAISQGYSPCEHCDP